MIALRATNVCGTDSVQISAACCMSLPKHNQYTWLLLGRVISATQVMRFAFGSTPRTPCHVIAIPHLLFLTIACRQNSS